MIDQLPGGSQRWTRADTIVTVASAVLLVPATMVWLLSTRSDGACDDYGEPILSRSERLIEPAAWVALAAVAVCAFGAVLPGRSGVGRLTGVVSATFAAGLLLVLVLDGFGLSIHCRI
ncbi:MAG: hypothetical protein V9E83_11350 [Baekduia sp.]